MARAGSNKNDTAATVGYEGNSWADADMARWPDLKADYILANFLPSGSTWRCDRLFSHRIRP